jgi:hypothetical protein
VLREVFMAKRKEVRGGWENCIPRSFMICVAHQMLLDEDEWAELWQLGVWENRNAYRVFVGRLQGRDSLKDMGVVGRIILKCILKKQDGRVWGEFVWLSG